MSDVRPIIQKIEAETLRSDLPSFRVGDTVRVNVRIREGEKERVQAFEGVCIRVHRGGARASFTVRKISYGVGVERVFPLHSPRIESIELVQQGRVRQARLYYLRQRAGKRARIRTLIRDDHAAQAASPAAPTAPGQDAVTVAAPEPVAQAVPPAAPAGESQPASEPGATEA